MNPLKWRKMSWLIIIFTVLMAIWIIGGTSSSPCPPDVANCDAYAAGQAIGTGIGVTILFFIWLVGFLILSVIWFMTKPKNRICPVCGNDVKKGRTSCGKCGHDFSIAPTASIGS